MRFQVSVAVQRGRTDNRDRGGAASGAAERHDRFSSPASASARAAISADWPAPTRIARRSRRRLARATRPGAPISDAGDREAGVNARDRIGNGPWKNAKGVVIARNIGELAQPDLQDHQADRADREGRFRQRPRRHAERARHAHRLNRTAPSFPGQTDATCSNWTSSADGQGGALVGHTDLVGNSQGVNFWNSSHMSPGVLACQLAASRRRRAVLLFRGELTTQTLFYEQGIAAGGARFSCRAHFTCVVCSGFSSSSNIAMKAPASVSAAIAKMI